MKTILHLFSLLAAFGLANCGPSTHQRREGPPPPELSQKEAVQVDDQTDVECRWITPTGSSIRKRVCKSRFEWEMEKQSAKDFLQRPRAGPQVGQ